MLESFLNMNVVRSLPTEVFAGLMTGQYAMHGGVIRWAADTERAGQIVRHLIPVAENAIGLANPLVGTLVNGLSTGLGAINTYQLHKLSGKIDALAAATQQILQVATGTMVLSGLNLAVSAIGFAMIHEKLKAFDNSLAQIKTGVKAIQQFLDMEERSKLAYALRDLFELSNATLEHRKSLLLNSKNILGPISLKYKELLENCKSVEAAMAYEEYFCLTSLAHARCLAELGMTDKAAMDLKDMNQIWRLQARRIAYDLLMLNFPERFLHREYAQEVPVSVLIEWMDFVYDEEKGHEWIDELRNKTPPMYYQSYTDLLKVCVVGNKNSRLEGLKKDKNLLIPALNKLVARSKVLNGFIAQYELLEKNGITPSEFEKKLALIPPRETVDGYIILKPTDSN